jgi:hypothetical protein
MSLGFWSAFLWQIYQGVITWPAAHTHAVHPLQLYFALAGVAVYLGGRYWQRRATFAGQVWLNVLLLYFGTTFFLELLGGYRLYLNIAICAVISLGLAILNVGVRLCPPFAPSCAAKRWAQS